VLSVTFARAVSGLLYGGSPLEPVTLSSVVGIVLVVTTFAALRAAFVQPMRVLRED
jgi:hypothetical protein